MIKERLCSYKLSKLLQEKGFDAECANWYVDEELDVSTINDCIGPQSNSDHWAEDFECTAPTHQMAMDWLRIVYRINIIILPSRTDVNFFRYQIIYSPNPLDDIFCPTAHYCHEYGQAVEEACRYALEFLVDKNRKSE